MGRRGDGGDPASREQRPGEQGDHGGPRLRHDLRGPGLQRRVHEGEPARDQHGREGGAQEAQVEGPRGVPRGQKRAADEDQGVAVEPIGGLLQGLRPGERGEPVECDREPGDGGAVPLGLQRGGEVGQEAQDDAALHEREEHHQDGPGVLRDEADPREGSRSPAPLRRFGQPAGEDKAQDPRGDRRRCEGEAPEPQVGREPRRGRGEGGRHRARGELVRQGPLPAGDRHGVANVDEGGRYHRGEEPARQRPAREEDREVGRRRREQPGRQDAEQRQPHHPHTPEPVGEHPPDRLHQAVEEVVQARRRRHLGERDAEAGRDGHQHRRDGELSNVLRKAAARRSRRGPFRSSWPRVSWASIASTA